ncbi:hypothetical protein [Polyangium jinanense]|uniref:Uncharacterized protein n=1 Tax=Polyangium jinanense TaxID=2829994 RepID=A0A9X4APV8_9BACT|nr:hypothetical protein [Polyangium jinanense]MDC3953178.1 hypothetical protein [Polyangium jinanense]MDC3979701.1 hypothetical protein [Polyangium jinanense]
MNPLLRAVAIGVFALVLPSCSIMDPDDRQALRDRLAAMAPEDMVLLRRTVLNAKGLNYFQQRPSNDQVGRLFCREYADGQWGDWKEEKRWEVKDVIECLMTDGLAVTFILCKDKFLYTEMSKKKGDIMAQQIPGKDAECRFDFDWRYEPEKLPEEIWKEESISFDDVIDVLVSLPAPPPGFIAPELVPLLCPLGAGPGWGCPSDPATEGDPPPEGGG